MSPRQATRIARLHAPEAEAKRLADRLAEALDPDRTAIATFAHGDGWAVAIHSDVEADESGLRGLVRDLAGPTAAAALTFETIAATDWVATSLAGLAPVRAGRFLVHGSHDRARVAKENRIGIEIEAALAFGTGHHGTTRACLLALDRAIKRRAGKGGHIRVLDIGTGSGVLAIAAAKALRTRVLASDLDPQAVRVARANTRRNRVGGMVEVVRATGTAAPRLRQRGRYDLVFANILLEPLRRLARPIAHLAAPRAQIVLSGLLRAQANAIVSAGGAVGLRLEARIDLDGWTTLVMRRNLARGVRAHAGSHA
jgi:ribosomal protein L11 methyltransferase